MPSLSRATTSNDWVTQLYGAVDFSFSALLAQAHHDVQPHSSFQVVEPLLGRIVRDHQLTTLPVINGVRHFLEAAVYERREPTQAATRYDHASAEFVNALATTDNVMIRTILLGMSTEALRRGSQPTALFQQLQNWAKHAHGAFQYDHDVAFLDHAATGYSMAADLGVAHSLVALPRYMALRGLTAQVQDQAMAAQKITHLNDTSTNALLWSAAHYMAAGDFSAYRNILKRVALTATATAHAPQASLLQLANAIGFLVYTGDVIPDWQSRVDQLAPKMIAKALSHYPELSGIIADTAVSKRGIAFLLAVDQAEEQAADMSLHHLYLSSFTRSTREVERSGLLLRTHPQNQALPIAEFAAAARRYWSAAIAGALHMTQQGVRQVDILRHAPTQRPPTYINDLITQVERVIQETEKSLAPIVAEQPSTPERLQEIRRRLAQGELSHAHVVYICLELAQRLHISSDTMHVMVTTGNIPAEIEPRLIEVLGRSSWEQLVNSGPYRQLRDARREMFRR